MRCISLLVSLACVLLVEAAASDGGRQLAGGMRVHRQPHSNGLNTTHVALCTGTHAADALLQLKALASDTSSLQSWRAGTDPCGGVETCAFGTCSWTNLACDQYHVVAV